MIEALAFAKRFWHWFALAGLLFVVLYMRGDIAKLTADREKAEARAATLQAVNDSNKQIIEGFAEQRLANDAIIQQLAAGRQVNTVRETNVRTIVEREARNDPLVRDWLNEPVPSGVRDAVNARR